MVEDKFDRMDRVHSAEVRAILTLASEIRELRKTIESGQNNNKEIDWFRAEGVKT